jgi:hypothetical protein
MASRYGVRALPLAEARAQQNRKAGDAEGEELWVGVERALRQIQDVSCEQTKP